MPLGRQRRVRRRRMAAAGAAGAYAVNKHEQHKQEEQEQQEQPQAAPAAAPPQGAPVDTVAQLTELKALLDSGALTQEEFETEKQKIIGA